VDGHKQFITAGGGGAFLHGTHNLPDKLDRTEGNEGVCYEKKESYPDAKCSAALVWKNLLFPFRNAGFSFFLGGIYLLYAWLLQSASVVFNDDYYPGTFMSQVFTMPLNLGGIAAVGKSYLEVLFLSPVNVIFMLIIVMGMGAFIEAPPGRTVARHVVGTIHGLSHLVLNIFLIWGVSVFNLGVLALDVSSLMHTALFIVEMLLCGALSGGLLMGVYLLVTNRLLAFNRTAALSSVRVADYKSFLRMHISEDGLAIYPIGVDKVPKRWRFVPEGDRAAPWFEPVDRPIVSKLLEQPVRLDTSK
jgi:hypothetical protein